MPMETEPSISRTARSRRSRGHREESTQQAKLVAKIEVLKAVENDLKQQLADLNDAAKKAEKAKEAKAKKAAKAKAEKDLLRVITKSGLSIEEIKEKLGI